MFYRRYKVDILCKYRDADYRLKNIKFNSFRFFGKWVADNATEIRIIDVIVEED